MVQEAEVPQCGMVSKIIVTSPKSPEKVEAVSEAARPPSATSFATALCPSPLAAVSSNAPWLTRSCLMPHTFHETAIAEGLVGRAPWAARGGPGPHPATTMIAIYRRAAAARGGGARARHAPGTRPKDTTFWRGATGRGGARPAAPGVRPTNNTGVVTGKVCG